MIERVELVIGLVGPIGCPIAEAEIAISDALKRVDYSSTTIGLSRAMDGLLTGKSACSPPTGESELYNKIQKGNAVREAFNNNAVLAAEAIRQVRETRCELNKDFREKDDEQRKGFPLPSHAFIIRQLKTPEEVDLLIKTFGKRFIQVSVVTTLEKRKQELVHRLQNEQHGWTLSECEKHADQLIEKDQDEKSEAFGQRISKIFHLADVFLNGETEETLRNSSQRFIDALFGRTNISPTRDEFASYIAKAASLRSVDLSRQVGAAIATTDGDLISIGCNEVPKAGGGNFWDEHDEKRRDVDLGGEANKKEINRIVFDFIEVLKKRELLRNDLDAKSILLEPENRKAIKKSLVGGITEYGRMVHAEMNALCDAARLGRSVFGATIYVTTYPCHNCAKHLVAAGIKRIVFIEPYPKSKTETLYQNIVSSDASIGEAVSIEHFFGISPRRYRDIFEKAERQTETGEVEKWYKGLCAPRLGPIAINTTEQELHALIENLYDKL